ncbi:MAG TPA: hypothetical protein VFO46_25305 [Candidatus Sulfotelmatobacter sp.]|nr:hypothetical protein [Candidatus Sulfotelmatobacter sp.]
MSILLNGAVEGHALGKLLITALNYLRQGNQPYVDSLLSTDTPGVIASTLYPANGGNLAFYVARLNAGVVVVLVSGIESLQAAAGLYSGYWPATNNLGGSVNSWSQAQADAIKALLIAKGWWGGSANFIAAGHSAGGTVAPILADTMKQAFPSYRVCWHTFGSPRLGMLDRAQVAERTPGARWFWHADPVPLLPLRFADAPWLVPVLGYIPLLHAGLYVHWRGGWQLIPGEVGHPEELPVDAAVSPVTSIATWLANIESEPNSGHNVHEYQAFMEAECSLLTNTDVNPTRLEPVEQPESLQRRVVNRVEAQFAESIANAEHRQNAIPVVIPTPEVWKAVRQGRIWIVTLGDQQIAIAGGKKAARGLARLMNEAFRRLQRTAVVDPTALTQQLDAYLVAASDPAGAFRPVMNTTF